MATGKAAPVHPVAAVKPGVIKETRGAEEMRGLAALLAPLPGEVARVRSEFNAFACVIKFL